MNLRDRIERIVRELRLETGYNDSDLAAFATDLAAALEEEIAWDPLEVAEGDLAAGTVTIGQVIHPPRP